MKNVMKVGLSLLLATMIAMPLLAQDQPKKPKQAPKQTQKQAGPVAGIMKQLEKAELTDEQKVKIKALAAKLPAQNVLTPDQQKVLKAAMEKAKAEGKTMKDMAAIRDSVLTLTDEQKAGLAKAQEARRAVMKEILALLTPEQIEKAELKVPAGKKAGAKKGGGKKKQNKEE